MPDFQQDAWNWLKQELDRWHALEMRAEFWWRDDDAVDVTAQLEKLCAYSSQYSVPLSLAVIPQNLQTALPPYLVQMPTVQVLQHGFAHISHAQKGQKKLELGGEWKTDAAIPCLIHGRDRLQAAFSQQFVGVMVPPWNRIENRFASALKQSGYLGISTMKARKTDFISPSFNVINTHLDPINWRHGAGFLGVFPCIAILIQHLVAKRCGFRDPNEPTGLLTHHLVQNRSVWLFVAKLLPFLSEHPAVKWVDAKSLWKA